MTDESIYFKHLAGVAAFMAWCERWTQFPQGLHLDEQHVARLGSIAAQRFGIGWPKRKRYATSPVLLYQQTEGHWLENIQWTRASLCPQASSDTLACIFLVSKMIMGDDHRFMRIPAFVVKIPLAVPQAQAWADGNPSTIELRLLWDEEGRQHIDRPCRTIPLDVVASQVCPLTQEEMDVGVPFHEMLEKRLMETGLDINPGFRGLGTVKIDDPYLRQQVEYRSGLGNGNPPGAAT